MVARDYRKTPQLDGGAVFAHPTDDSSIAVRRQLVDTVNVSVAIRGVGMGVELSAESARALSKSLLDVARQIDLYEMELDRQQESQAGRD